MKKFLDSDWLRAVQLKSNTSAKRIIPVQKSIFSPQVSEIGIVLKKFHKPPITFEDFPRVSEVFRAFPNTSEDFRKFLKISKSVGRAF